MGLGLYLLSRTYESYYWINCLFIGFCYENIFTINAVCLGFIVLEIFFPVIITSHIPLRISPEVIAALAIIFGLLEIYGTVKKNFTIMIISFVYRCIRLSGFCLLLAKHEDWLLNWTHLNGLDILYSFIVWDSIKLIIIAVAIHRIRVNERNGYQSITPVL